MTFTTKVLPGPTLCPLGDAQEPPAPGPEPAPSREQGAGKNGDGKPAKVAGKGVLGSTDQESLKTAKARIGCPRYWVGGV